MVKFCQIFQICQIKNILTKSIEETKMNFDFGELRQGGIFEYKINVKNEDFLAQRIVLKQPLNNMVSVKMKQMGSISLGLVREVFIKVNAERPGQFQDKFQVMTKHSIYNIPVSVNILEQSIYDKLSSEQIKLSSKPLLKKQVKDLKQIKQQDIIGDSQDSNLLPKINNDKNLRIDPYLNQNKEEVSEDEN